MNSNARPSTLAAQFALEIVKREFGLVGTEAHAELYPTNQYGPRVRDAKGAAEHGYMPGALATVTYEGGVDLISILGARDWSTDRYYIDAYSTYMVGIFRK